MKTIIIAEAGVNHNGDLTLAKKLVDIAKDSGADYVKFQTAVPELIITEQAPKAKYQKEAFNEEVSQLEMAKRIHLKLPEFIELKEYCDIVGIPFLSTPFDSESLEFLSTLGMEIFKIPSGEINNLPFLKEIASLGKEVILSTGMSTVGEVESALEILKSYLSENKISILHCTTEYPAPFEEVNLKVIKSLRRTFGLKTGYSDHTKGIEISIAAVAMGASIIEKHFTLDKAMVGPDHKASLSPVELKNMVSSIRNVEKAVGNGVKKVTPSEFPNIVVARKSIHIKINLEKGSILSESDLIMKRPGDGIKPAELKYIIGRKLVRDLVVDSKLSWNDFE